MTLILRFLDQASNYLIADTPAVKADVTFGLNQTGEFTADVPVNTEALQYVSNGNTVQVLFEGEILLEGTLQSYGQSFDDEGIVSIKGRDILDDLYRHRAIAYAFFDDVPLLTALAYLLHQAGWLLGDISTVEDLTETITLDLRSEKYLIEQISKVISGVPKMAYRYGGLQNGIPTLDIGYFGQTSFMQFVSAPADAKTINESQGVGFISSLKVDTEITQKTHTLELYGGGLQDAGGGATCGASDGCGAD